MGLRKDKPTVSRWTCQSDLGFATFDRFGIDPRLNVSVGQMGAFYIASRGPLCPCYSRLYDKSECWIGSVEDGGKCVL